MRNIIPLGILVATLISYNVILGNPIIKGPVDRYSLASPEGTLLLECLVDTATEISSVSWWKTSNVIESIYNYDGSKGGIFPVPPPHLTWKYRVLEENEQQGNFTLEIADISLMDVGTYTCQVESDDVFYSEQAKVTVYGSAEIKQSPELAVHGESSYDFFCSVEIALVSNSSENTTPATPTISLRNPASALASNWTGLNPFGKDVPIYRQYGRVNGKIDYNTPTEIGCQIVTPENQEITLAKRTDVGGSKADTPFGSKPITLLLVLSVLLLNIHD